MRTVLRDRQALLACVEGSPAAVALHNKPEWLSLFADCAVVEDPVGSKPQINLPDERGHSPLSQFYETFIAANDIQFHVDYDVVCAGAVVRDLDIEIQMSDKVRVRVPMHLLYELTTENGEVRIKRLAAHWELGPMLRQQMRFGVASAISGISSFWRMLRHMGLSGLQGFLQARETVGEAGKEKVKAFVSAFNNKQGRAVERLFTDDGMIAWPYGHEKRVAFLEMPTGQLRVEKLLSAGRVTTATLYYREGEIEKRGVAIFNFDRRNLLISNAQFFIELGEAE